MIHHQNVAAEAACAEDEHAVAGIQRKAALHAQQVQAGHAEHHRRPDQPAKPAAKEKTGEGNKHNVKRGDEPGLASAGAEREAHLLGNAAQSQHDAAANAAQNEGLSLGTVHLLPGHAFAGLYGAAVAEKTDRQKRESGQQHARAVEGHGLEYIRRHILRCKCAAPDNGCEQQKEICTGLRFHSKHRSFRMSGKKSPSTIHPLAQKVQFSAIFSAYRGL